MRPLASFIYIIFVVVLGNTNIFGTDDFHTLILSLMLSLYCLSEVFILYKQKIPFFFINPIIISTFVTFGLSFGAITNYFLFTDGVFQIKFFAAILENERYWIKYTMSLICLAALFTWLGYRMNTGRRITEILLKTFQLKNILGSNIDLNRLIIITILAYLIKLYLFNIGLYGRVVSEQYFEQKAVGYKLGSQIRVLSSLSYLTFILISYLFFKRDKVIYKYLFYFCLILELFFAFIYGARGPFLIPFLIIFVCNYYVNKKIKVWTILVFGFVPLFLAFSFVAGFKNYTLSKQFVRVSNPLTMLSNYLSYSKRLSIRQKSQITSSVGEKILGSTNFICEATMGVRHKDIYGLTNEDPSPTFNLLMSPIDAFIPKFLQPVKHTPAWGQWFKNKVLNYNPHLSYSIAMTPISFLYFIGGPLMVCFGFWTYGIMLQITYQYLSYGILGFLVFLALLSGLYSFDSIYSATIVNFIRYVFIYPFIFWFIFRK